MKELTSDRKSFDSPVRDVNRRLLVHDDTGSTPNCDRRITKWWYQEMLYSQ